MQILKDRAGLGTFIGDRLSAFASSRIHLESDWRLNADVFGGYGDGWLSEYASLATPDPHIGGIPAVGSRSSWRSDIRPNLAAGKIHSMVETVRGSFGGDGDVPFKITAPSELLAQYGTIVFKEIEERVRVLMRDASCGRLLSEALLVAAVRNDSFVRYCVGPFTTRDGRLARGPHWETIDPMRVYWDMQTFQPHDGDGCMVRYMMRMRDVSNMQYRVEDGYFPAAVRAWLDSQPDSRFLTAGGAADRIDRHGSSDWNDGDVEVYDFWMWVPVAYYTRYMDALEGGELFDGERAMSLADPDVDRGDCVLVGGTAVEGAVVRLYLVDSIPVYRLSCYAPVAGVRGRGVMQGLRGLQDAYASALRSYTDNTRIAGDVLLAVRHEMFEDPNALDVLAPGKTLQLAEDCEDARQAVQQIVVQDVSQGHLNLMAVLQRMIDEESGIPRAAQGLGGTPTGTGTAYELQQVLNNSALRLANIVRRMDDTVASPMLRHFLDYVLAEAGLSDIAVGISGNCFPRYREAVMDRDRYIQLLNIAGQFPEAGSSIEISEVVARIVDTGGLDRSVLKDDSRKAADAEAAAASPEAELAMQERLADLRKTEASAEQLRVKAEATASRAGNDTLKRAADTATKSYQAETDRIRALAQAAAQSRGGSNSSE